MCLTESVNTTIFSGILLTTMAGAHVIRTINLLFLHSFRVSIYITQIVYHQELNTTNLTLESRMLFANLKEGLGGCDIGMISFFKLRYKFQR